MYGSATSTNPMGIGNAAQSRDIETAIRLINTDCGYAGGSAIAAPIMNFRVHVGNQWFRMPGELGGAWKRQDIDDVHSPRPGLYLGCVTLSRAGSRRLTL